MKSQSQMIQEKYFHLLLTDLAGVREALQRANPQSGGEISESGITSELNSDPDRESPLDQLCAQFSLSLFERDLLLLCAGVELDPSFASLCAAAHGDQRMSYATFGLALSIFPQAHWSAVAPNGALRRWRLIEVGAGGQLTASPLRIDERVLHYLTGISYIDERVHSLVETVDAPADLPISQQEAVLLIAGMWAEAKDDSLWPVIQLFGNDTTGKRAVAAAACAVLGFQLYAIRAADLPAIAAEHEIFARLWERETVLSRRALLIDDEDRGVDGARGLLSLIERAQGFFVVTAGEPMQARNRRIARVDVNRPSAAEQKAIWRSALGPAVENLNGRLDLIATHFDLSLQAIKATSSEALRRCRPGGEEELDVILWNACRAHARPRLDELAQRIEPSARWDDLVLPPLQLQTLRTIAAHIRRRAFVYDNWGFASKGLRGLGISALFSGASGTGKTMAAEVLAGELRLDLYRIDLSALVSKYIGETEKNLRRVFDAAEESGAILLFDEADALFGRRSEVKDSHDRYANIEVSYLLQRIETYRGLAVLTSNLKNAMDSAFLRRIRFIVHFPFPDSAQRTEIWKRIFPVDTPTESLNLDRLARLNLSGGNIRNLALNAAFLAADAGEPVQMRHLLIAAQAEYSKLEKPLGEAEIGGWA